jgi:hypothetical protein
MFYHKKEEEGLDYFFMSQILITMCRESKSQWIYQGFPHELDAREIVTWFDFWLPTPRKFLVYLEGILCPWISLLEVRNGIGLLFKSERDYF